MLVKLWGCSHVCSLSKTNISQNVVLSSSLSLPEKLLFFSLFFSGSFSNLISDGAPEFKRSQTAPSTVNSVDEHHHEFSGQRYECSELQLEHLAATVVKQVLNNALSVMNGQCQANTHDCSCKSGEQTNCTSAVQSCKSKVCLNSADGHKERMGRRQEKVQQDERGAGVEERTELLKMNWEVERGGRDQENILDICCQGNYCYGIRQSLDEFKDFLRGTPGEKLFNLWMDIERLKSTQSRERKNRWTLQHQNIT